MKTFDFEVITPERTLFKEQAVSITVPAEGGSMGILADHAPMLAVIETGIVTVRKPDDEVARLMVAGGFLEVNDNRVRLLAEVGEHEDQIDLERALEAAKRARERLKHRMAGDVDVIRAEAALLRAMIRERIARELRGKSSAR